MVGLYIFFCKSDSTVTPLRFEVLFILYGISCLRRVTLSIDDGLHRVGNDLQERFGGCLLSPGQRYLEISPPQARIATKGVVYVLTFWDAVISAMPVTRTASAKTTWFFSRWSSHSGYGSRHHKHVLASMFYFHCKHV